MTSGAAADVSPLGVADLGDALALSVAAGWNQTADDWLVFIGAGHGFAVRDAGGRAVGTAAVLPYGGTAWISMVLVDASLRHRGIASRLVAACLGRVAELGAVAALDATADGEPVYARLGFRRGFRFERWQGRLRGGASSAGGGHGVDAAALAALESAASGLPRQALVESFLRRPGSRVVVDGPAGFAFVRAGQRARQLGPLVAADEASAIRLLDEALAGDPGQPVFLDVPERWRSLAGRLEALGFVRQRGFVRMSVGEPPAEPGDRQFVLAGPEFG